MAIHSIFRAYLHVVSLYGINKNFPDYVVKRFNINYTWITTSVYFVVEYLFNSVIIYVVFRDNFYMHGYLNIGTFWGVMILFRCTVICMCTRHCNNYCSNSIST